MHQISSLVASRQSLVVNRTTNDYKLSDLEVSKVIESLNYIEKKWHPYYAKALRKLGINRFLDIEQRAAGKGRLFAHLIKQELAKS